MCRTVVVEAMMRIYLVCFVLGTNCERCIDGYWGNPVNGGNCTGKTVKIYYCHISIQSWSKV